MTYRLIPILCLLAAPPRAGSVCPRGPEALTSGVRIAFDGLQVDFQRQPDGRILETERHDGEAEIWFYVSDPSGLMFTSWMRAARAPTRPRGRPTATISPAACRWRSPAATGPGRRPR
jgi:hypothetical protein